jgi:hypothetical protein
MIRRVLAFVVGVIVAATLADAADEPPPDQTDAPLRLKKKKPAMGDPAKPEEKKSDDKPDAKKPDQKKEEKKADGMQEPITRDGDPVNEEEDEMEVLERVARNAKTVEERLVNQEVNSGTRQLQNDIVKDLDSLIKNSENPQGGEQGEEGMQQGEENQNNKQGKQGKQSKSSSRKSSGKQKSGKQKQKGSRMQSGGGQGKAGQENKPGQGEDNQPMGNNPGKGGNAKEKQTDPQRDADLFKDTWGHLPETLRAQMNAYSNREKYMDKHQELIKQYYKTIAAQNRRKGE